MSITVKNGKRRSESTNKKEGFTAEEKAAMKARARELKDKADGESAVRTSIAAMSPQDRAIAKRLHELIKAAAPDLSPKTWYGMPAYAKDGKVLCFVRNAGKFKERYAPPGRTSISSTTVPSPHHSGISFASVQTEKTCARGASKIRSTRISSSFGVVTVVVFIGLLSCVRRPARSGRAAAATC
jgi:uncharacterized protein YdhG (YjbR/CyaY superfamily)